MKRVILGLAIGLALGSVSAQQVWRCEQDGQVRYTDQPCEKSGRPLPARDLKVNVADGLAAEAARAASAASGSPGASDPSASAPDSAAEQHALTQSAKVQPTPTSSRRTHRGKRAPLVAMQGLMDTDFVQRGYAPRRQNPASTTNP